MNIDTRTLSFIIGMTNCLLAIAIVIQHRINKIYKGPGWWALGCVSTAAAFMLMLLSDIVRVPVILINTMLFCGLVFIYTGIMRFLNRKENISLIFILITVFFFLSFYVLYFIRNNFAATLILYFSVVIIVTLISKNLIFHGKSAVNITARFMGAVFFIYGCFYLFKIILALATGHIDSIFKPSPVQTVSFMAMLAVSILLTFGFIIMLYQQLSAESLEDRELFELIFESIPEATIIIRLNDGLIMNINEALTTATGYTRNELIGSSILDLDIWADPDEGMNLISEISEKGFCLDRETAFRLKPGRVIHGIITARMIMIHGIKYILCITRDVTERRQMEAALSENREYLRAVIDSVNDAVFIHNEKGDIIDVNRRMCEMYGYTYEEALEVTIGEISQGEPPFTHEDALVWLAKAKETGFQNFEWKSRRKNGEIFTSDVSIRFVKVGGKDYCVVTDHDVTDREKVREELTRIKKAVETASNAIWITDHRAEKVVYSNRAFTELFRYTGEELNKKGGSAALYIDPATALSVFCKVKNHGSFTSEVTLRTGEGNDLLINLYADVVKDETGKPTAYLGIATDITDKKRTEAELIESRQRLADIIQFFPDPIIVIDREGKVTAWNRAIENLTGVPAENMLGKGNYEYSIPFYGEPRPILIDYALNIDTNPGNQYAGFERSGNLITGEAYMPNLRGGQVYLYGTATALYNTGGEITGAIESIRDISERKKTEEELIRIKKAVEVASNAIWLTDRKAEKIIYNNLAFTQLFKYTGEGLNMRGGAPAIFTDPNMAGTVYNSLRKGRSWSNEVLMKTSEGENLCIYLYADVVKDESGQHTAYLGIATDITEKKHIETELIESRQQMSDIIQFFPEPVLVINNEGKVVAWNRAIEDLTGTSAVDMIGKGNYEYAIPFYGVRRPILVDLVLKSESESEKKYNVFKRTGELVEAEVYIPDFRGKDVYFTGVSIALYNPRGEIVGAIESIRDITERKKTEQLLLMEKERLSITLRSIGDGVIVTDISGGIILINKVAEGMLGWEQHELTGMPLMDYFNIIDSKTRIRHRDIIREVIETGNIAEIDSKTILINRNGTERMISDSAAPVRDKDSRMIGVIIVFRDVTEKQKMEDELLKTQKLESIGIIAGGIAHDFNNILTGIIGYISLARKIVNPDNRIYGMLAEVEKASLRATNLTQQLLTFSKGWAPIRKTLLINDLLKESAAFVLSGTNIKCDVSIHDDLKPVEIDEGQINQVINNLVINARQAMPDGGTIEISAENVIIEKSRNIPVKNGSYIMVRITDHGTGIPENIQSKIFDPFFTTKQSGNGLGLSTSYSIIRKHDGYIMMESRPGSGTTFSIYLPASLKPAGQDSLKKGRDSYSLNGKVLVIDDELIIRNTATEMLKFFGLEAVTAADSNDALDLFIEAAESGKPYDLVIMDLTIPGGLGGKDAVKKFRTIDPLAKIIASSGYSNDPIMSDFGRYGFSGIIVKPYKIDDLYNEIKNCLK